MTVTINDKIRPLPAGRRRKVAARAAELIGEEMTLRDLRKARDLTQAELGKSLGLTQDAISRLEARSDVLLSTLRRTIAAMGGSLSLVADFPNRPCVVVLDIRDLSPPRPKRARSRTAART